MSVTLQSAPSFPPILTAHHVRAPAVPFEAALEGAARGTLGARDLLWSCDSGRAQLALVLEPDVSGQVALQMAPLMFIAVADCLGALMEPHTSVLLRWPRTVMVNAGDVGTIDFAMDPQEEHGAPEWLVVGASLQYGSLDDVRAPGAAADLTALKDEGIGSNSPEALLKSLAAHFLTWLYVWQDRGFQAVQQHLAGRLEGHDADTAIRIGDETLTGRAVGIDDSVALLVKPVGRPVRAIPFGNAAQGASGRAK